MAVNKVIYGDTTLIDLTSDTVAADKILEGYTAHDKSGTFITGTYSSKNATLTVTYSEDFYGATITATNGSKTLTAVATSSGSVEFKLPEDGTWTVSATVEGQTYSESVLVDTSYNTELLALPNGSTATPVNVIQTWLRCAQIKDKAYTTLSQVLNDTATLEALVSDSNACDYMARSTNWASGVTADANAMKLIDKFDYCANKLLSNATWAEAIAGSTYFESVLNVKVPTMTSNTTPSGEAGTTGAITSGYEPWRAFSGNPDSDISSNGWLPNVWGVIGWYKFTSPQKIKCAKIRLVDGNQRLIKNTVQVYASNDNSTWTPIGSSFVMSGTNVWDKVILNDDTSYQYWGFKIIDSTTGHVVNNGYGYRMQFYGRAESTMIPLVPKMTSNTTPSGEASASSYYPDRPATLPYKAFDGDDSTRWDATGGTNEWLCYDFGSTVKVYGFSVRSTNHSDYIRLKNFKIQGSNDNFVSDVNDLYTGIYPNSEITFSDILTSVGNYRYYRLYAIDNYTPAGSSVEIATLQFYTSADTDTQVLFRSAAQDDLYYLDNGSPVIIAHTDDNGYAIVDRDLLPEGVNLTLYSTVAKDPTNLGSAYSKTVHFSKYLTEVYLRPFNSLYWWGYNGGIEIVKAENGWTMPSGYNMQNPNIYTNYISVEATYSPTVCGIGSIRACNMTKAHCIGNQTRKDNQYSYVGFLANPQKAFNAGTTWDVSNTPIHYTSDTTGENYIEVCAYYTSIANVYALWYE